jgi:hypothetical protein
MRVEGSNIMRLRVHQLANPFRPSILLNQAVLTDQENSINVLESCLAALRRSIKIPSKSIAFFLLRGDGPHVRGCWAFDLVLGKE